MKNNNSELETNDNAISNLCKDCIINNTKEKLLEIENLFQYSEKEKRWILFRNYEKMRLGIDTIARDDIFNLKTACIHFNLHIFDKYFESVTFRKKLSKDYRASFDFLCFLKNKNFLWQIFLLFSVIFSWLLMRIVRTIGGLKQTQPHLFKPKDRIYELKEDGINHRITTFKQLWRHRHELKNLNWKFLEYWAADIALWYGGYTLLQTCWALYVSKEIFLLTYFIQAILRSMAWKENPEVYYLTGKESDYPFCYDSMGSHYYDFSNLFFDKKVYKDKAVDFLKN